MSITVHSNGHDSFFVGNRSLCVHVLTIGEATSLQANACDTDDYKY